MTHLMLDLETLGTDTDCVVTQIGFCGFELNMPGMITFEGLIRPDPNEQIFERKRTITWDTFKWWMGQTNEARESMIASSNGEMYACLKNFIEHVNMQTDGWDKIEGVWANGISFDIVIMENIFKQYRIKCPWKYNAPRDTRTLWALIEDKSWWEKPTVAHNAISDAICQAKNVQHAYAALKGINHANG